MKGIIVLIGLLLVSGCTMVQPTLDKKGSGEITYQQVSYTTAVFIHPNQGERIYLNIPTEGLPNQLRQHLESDLKPTYALASSEAEAGWVVSARIRGNIIAQQTTNPMAVAATAAGAGLGLGALTTVALGNTDARDVAGGALGGMIAAGLIGGLIAEHYAHVTISGAYDVEFWNRKQNDFQRTTYAVTVAQKKSQSNFDIALGVLNRLVADQILAAFNISPHIPATVAPPGP